MKDVKKKQCESIGCTTRPNFNWPDEQRGIFCGKHKKAGMRDVTNQRCGMPGCTTTPIFNWPNEKRGRFCLQHRDPGMQDVRNQRCVMCARTQPKYNLPGLRPWHCSDHVQPGMIRNPRVRCTHPQCDAWSTHGRTAPLRCESHAVPTDTNLVERECTSCGLTMVLCGTGHCEYCDPAAARKRRRLAK
jgi:hypothetical protein